MVERADRVAALLGEAAELHHQVYRIVDGNDDDWASWYADWLLDLSELPEVLGARPVRSELVYVLVGLDRDYTRAAPVEGWPQYYAAGILAHFAPTEGRPRTDGPGTSPRTGPGA
jgi:hypothetical protein